MNDLLDKISAVVMLGVGVTLWVTNYVLPKQDVLFAATSCMESTPLDNSPASKEKWAACFEAAHEAHGTRLLEVVGY